MQREKIILDCDPGTDDAIAIMLALFCDEIDVIGISTVNGNRILPKTTENALRVKQFLGSDVPIYRGCENALVSKLIRTRKPELPRVTLNDCHGDYLKLPESTILPEKKHAVNFIVDTLMASDGDITLVTVGPLTNIAMALRLEPQIEQKIKRIVMMGGGLVGCNASASSEFNFYADPESAKIVIDTNIPKMILPLDATWRACITEDQCDKLDAIGTPAAKFAADATRLRIWGLKGNNVSEHNNILRHQSNTVAEALLYKYENDRAPVHDALAVAYVIDPDVVSEYIDANVDIDISGGICDGRLVADLHNTHKIRELSPVKVAVNADSDKFNEILFKYLARTKTTR